MQILLLQDRIEVREKIGFFLESTYGAKVHEPDSIDHAVVVIQNTKPPIDLIFLDSKQGTSAQFEQFWKAANGIPIILCAEGCPDGAALCGAVVGVVERATLMDSVVETIDELIEREVLKVGAPTTQVRIRTKLLLSVCPLKGDIYIRLSEQKFVKLFHEGDTFDLSDLERYTIKKGVEYLYIRKEQCKEFTHKYRGELHRLLQADPLSIEEAGKLGNSVHETVQELSAQIGFTKEVQELTKTHVQLTVKSMGKDPNLAEILKRLKASEGQYISYHSTLVSYFACAIAAEMHWGSETTFYKLALAAFMHDITLSNQGLAQLSSLEELERDKAKYTEQELKDFRGHPIDAAEMIKRMNEIPPDVDTIVIQHHERPDGTGFPRTLAYSYIAPLASVFIVAHDLAQYVCSSRAGFDIQEFITGKKEVYKASQFKKILLCLDSLGKVQSLAETLKKLQ